ncbi:MAG: transposase, partial [Deltaproteobacteria bacterium]|nr:transposase [Deltaproteobacteria bacterium]
MNSSTTAVSDLTNAKKSTPPVVREQIIKGVRYVYEDYPYWDKLKKQTRHKRVYKGHYDSEGNFVASKSYQNKDDSSIETKEIALTQVKTGRFIGATYLLDRIALKTGLYNDLKELFPDKYEQILSLAYYTTLENENNFYRFSKWAKTHFHPYNQVISSKRATDLISTISENDKIELFKRQVIRLQENEYLAYDTTSVSSYSENIKQLKYGHNKDGDNLAQINLALVLGENSLLPTYYRIFPGNINDSTTLDKLLIDFKFFNIENATFVFDRGFYSVQNIHRLHHDNFKYIIGVKNNLSYVANRIEELSTKKLDISNFSSKHNVYYYPYDIFMPFKKQHKGFNIDPPHKVKSTLHIYFDPAKAILDTINLNNKIKNAIENYKNDIKSAKITDIINKYCKINYNESNGLFSIDYNKVAIEDDT